MELLFGVIATFFLWLPTGPENSSFILSCLGKDDAIYFDFDYFTPGGYNRKKIYCHFDNVFGKHLCQGFLAVFVIITSNICEVYFTSAVILKMKKSTTAVKEMLSSKAIAHRKRYVFNFQLKIFLVKFFSPFVTQIDK